MRELEKRRREASLTQAQLAALVGVTQGAISMIESGERQPSLALVRKLATVLGCTVDELLK